MGQSLLPDNGGADALPAVVRDHEACPPVPRVSLAGFGYLWPVSAQTTVREPGRPTCPSTPERETKAAAQIDGRRAVTRKGRAPRWLSAW